MIRVLSLGAGVQSSVVLLMSCHGELPKLDAAVFADTGWEPRAVYEHLDWLVAEAARFGVPVYVVSQGNIREDSIDARVRVRTVDEYGKAHFASMPWFVKNPDGSKGMIRRQCTYEYKIRPIERWIKSEVLGLAKGQRAPKEPVVERWYGISADEPQRMRQSEHKWATNVYPLCGMPDDLLPKRFRRADCVRWFADRYPGRVLPRSACIGCPFHHDNEWRELRDASPAEWQDAVEFDRRIRVASGMRGETYSHASLLPLDQVNLSTAEDHGQLALWSNECEGMCGV